MLTEGATSATSCGAVRRGDGRRVPGHERAAVRDRRRMAGPDATCSSSATSSSRSTGSATPTSRCSAAAGPRCRGRRGELDLAANQLPLAARGAGRRQPPFRRRVRPHLRAAAAVGRRLPGAGARRAGGRVPGHRRLRPGQRDRAARRRGGDARQAHRAAGGGGRVQRRRRGAAVLGRHRRRPLRAGAAGGRAGHRQRDRPQVLRGPAGA